VVVALVAGLGELVEGVVAALDVRGVVLAVVVQLKDLPGHGGFERAVVVGHVRQRVSGHEDPPG
jgi:hypothetical protein